MQFDNGITKTNIRSSGCGMVVTTENPWVSCWSRTHSLMRRTDWPSPGQVWELLHCCPCHSLVVTWWSYWIWGTSETLDFRLRNLMMYGKHPIRWHRRKTSDIFRSLREMWTQVRSTIQWIKWHIQIHTLGFDHFSIVYMMLYIYTMLCMYVM